MHARLSPKRNAFSYGLYYLAVPLAGMDAMPLAYNRFAPLSFYDRDHGACDGSPLLPWARDILTGHDITAADGDITLLCMPRVFGYVFNPVSFYLCRDRAGHLRAVLCEVHNTFGERHTYICAHPDQRVIKHDDVMHAQKLFHVSPFLERAGQYTFRFDTRKNKFRTWIDFYNAQGDKQLVTSLLGDLTPMNKRSLRAAFWKYPLVSFKAITLIHVQALKIVTKGIKYITKPKQTEPRVSSVDGLIKKKQPPYD